MSNKLYFYKLLALPSNPQPDSIYLINTGHNTYNMYVTDRNGVITDQRTKVVPISRLELNGLANTNSLVKGELWFIEDEGRLAIPTANNTFNIFFAVHIGSTPPEDTTVIWFDTGII